MSSIWTVRRSATDAKAAGLCGGVAEHWGVDPVLVRVAWVLLALSGGVGVVLYLAGWLLIPVQGRDTAPADDLLGDAARRWPKKVWVTLVVVLCFGALTAFGSLTPFGVGPALVIACIWYFGFSKQPQDPPTPSAAAAVDAAPAAPAASLFLSHPGPPTPFTVAADRWRSRIEQLVEQGGPEAPAIAARQPAVARTPAPTPVQDPEVVELAAFLATADPVGLYVEASTPAEGPVERRHSVAARRLRLLTLLVLGLVLGGLSLADRSGVNVTPAGYAAAALLVVGLALLAATWCGRARGLLALGLLLVPVVALTSVADQVGPTEHWTDTSRTYPEVALLPSTPEQFGAGQARVDLSALKLGRDTSYAAHLDAGQLEVVVPSDVNVVVNYDVDFGQVDTFGSSPVSGIDLLGTVPPGPPVAGRPTLTLDLAVDGGHLVVRR